MIPEEVTNKTLIQKLLEDLAEKGERNIRFVIDLRDQRANFSGAVVTDIYEGFFNNLVIRIQED